MSKNKLSILLIFLGISFFSCNSNYQSSLRSKHDKLYAKCGNQYKMGDYNDAYYLATEVEVDELGYSDEDIDIYFRSAVQEYLTTYPRNHRLLIDLIDTALEECYVDFFHTYLYYDLFTTISLDLKNNQDTTILDYLLKKWDGIKALCQDITPLHEAIEYEYFEIAEYFISHNVDINSQDFTGFTPLHTATNLKKVPFNIVKLLFDKGANLNIESKMGLTPLFCIDKTNDDFNIKKNNLAVFKFLLEHGANINYKNRFDEYLIFLLINRNCLDFFKIALNHKADINIMNKQGETPLMVAIKMNNLDLVKCLVKHDKSIVDIDNDKNNHSQIAFKRGYCQIWDYLLLRNFSKSDED